jgi:hypothetical protein
MIFSEAKLPFEIDKSKKMDEEELKSKKEGSFFTGLPSISSDPITGIWYGGSGYYIDNGKKTNPLFAYQPYEYRVSVDVYQSSTAAKFYGAGIDLPYFKNSPYRINLYGFYDRNLKTQYFGVGEETLKPLSHYPRNDNTQAIVYNSDFNEREEALSFRRRGKRGSELPVVTDKFYNEYQAEQSGFTSSVDRTFWGKYRFAVGIDIYKTVIKTYDNRWTKAKDPFFGETIFPLINVDIPTPNGTTKLTEDSESKKILGLNGGYTNFLKIGLAYDTRDFEPNPRRGIFAEINYIKVAKAFGSDYEYQRSFVHLKTFYQLFPNHFQELIFATRVGLTRVTGEIPFFHYRYIWSLDGPILALGGDATTKGYKQDRFVGLVTGFGNLELRWRFANWNFKEESFAFQLVPAFSLGRVWDKIERVNLLGYKYSYIWGFRIIWNQSTVISMDYAWSREDRQFFLNLEHNF